MTTTRIGNARGVSSRSRSIVGLVALLALGAATARADVVEKETEIHFPDTVALDGKRLEALGAGVREKLWFDVYAAALYVDVPAIKRALSRYAGRNLDALRSDDAFYNDLVYADVTKVLVIRMARDVDAEAMREAFEDGLEPHMQIDDDARALMHEGDEVRIVWRPGAEVQMIFKGKAGKRFHNPKLAASLFKIWFGRKPVSKDIKRGAIERLPEKLHD